MIVKVLGTAQDGGVPHVACYCPTCSFARSHPADARRGPSLGVYDPDGGSTYLIDASPDFSRQLDTLRDSVAGVRVGRAFPLDAIFLTHGHFGHYWGLGYLGKEACSPKGLPVYVSSVMGEFLRQNRPFSDMIARGNLVLIEVSSGVAISVVPGLTLTPMLVPHRQDVTDTLGFGIAGPNKRLLYIPDMDDYTDEIIAAVAAADIALLDGCFFSGEELPGRNLKEIPHPFIPYSMDRLAHLVDRTEIYFTHFNHSNYVLRPGSPEREQVVDRGFKIANDGDSFVI